MILSASFFFVSAATFGLVSDSSKGLFNNYGVASVAVEGGYLAAGSLVIATHQEQQEEQVIAIGNNINNNNNNINNNNNNNENSYDDISNEKEESISVSVDDIFADYAQKFFKTYDSQDEYNRRKDIFEKNFETIQRHNNEAVNNKLKLKLKHNKHKHSWTMEINQFADMLPKEFPKGFDKGALHGQKAHDAFSETSSHSFSSVVAVASASSQNENGGRRNLRTAALPKSIDWRTYDSGSGNGSGISRVTTPIKDQGACGSCWAVAAATVLESHVAIATGKLFSLSPQELVSCAPNPNNCGGTGGCEGSTGELAYDYVSKHGMVSEWADGYTSAYGDTGNCTLHESSWRHDGYVRGAKVSVVGFSSLPTNDYDNLMYAVATMGPVVVSVAARYWGFYSGGVFDDSSFTEHHDIDHAVVLEGYGTDEETGEDFWLVRNSWGVLWGDNGYIRLKRTDPSTLIDPTSEDCKTDITPMDGMACAGPDNNATVPDQLLVCGTSGILYANVVPVGAHLVGY